MAAEAIDLVKGVLKEIESRRLKRLALKEELNRITFRANEIQSELDKNEDWSFGTRSEAEMAVLRVVEEVRDQMYASGELTRHEDA